MSRLRPFAIILLVFAALFVCGALIATREQSTFARGGVAWWLGLEARAFPGYEPGVERRVLFDAPAAENAEETAEQARDFLLLTVISSAVGAAPDAAQAIAAATFQSAPIRRGYSDTTSDPQTGIVRIAWLPDGTGVVLIPAGLSPNEQRDAIARAGDHLASRHGARPKRAAVFEYCLAPLNTTGEIDWGTLRLLKFIAHEDLYGPAYGFVARTITERSDLESFLASTDDVVGLKATGYTHVLEGRVYAARKYGRVTLEHLATIHTAYGEMKRATRDNDGEINALAGKLIDQEMERLEPRVVEQARAIHAKLLQEEKALQPRRRSPPNPFTLDPATRDRLPPAMRDMLENRGELEPAPMREPEALPYAEVLREVRVRAREQVSKSVQEEVKGAWSRRDSCDWRLQAAILRSGDASVIQNPADRSRILATPATVRQTILAMDDKFRSWEESRLTLLRGSVGFSLDQAYDPKRLHEAIAKSSANPVIANQLDKARQLFADDIAKGDAAGLTCAIQLLGLPPSESRRLVSTLLDPARYQFARYDGGIRGTEVGQILFYTDLLAKLWSMDFDRAFSAHFPSQIIAAGDDVEQVVGDRAIARLLLASAKGLEMSEQTLLLHGGFAPSTYTLSPTQYRAQEERLPGTRIWFDVRADAISKGSDGDAFIAPTVARVFARSRDNLDEKREEQPTFVAAQFVNWFNRRYEQVGAADPRFDQLNQLIKWAVLLDPQSDIGASLRSGGLLDISVKRDHWFPTWAAAQFPANAAPRWVKCFHPKGQYLPDVETMPVMHYRWPKAPAGDFWCASLFEKTDRTLYSINGGVSLPRWRDIAGESGDRARRIVAPLQHRAGLDFRAGISTPKPGVLEAVGPETYTWKTTYRISSEGDGVKIARSAEIVPNPEAEPGAPLKVVRNRGSVLELASANSSDFVKVSPGGGRIEIASSAGGAPIAKTTIVQGDVTLVVQDPRGIEIAGALAKELSAVSPARWVQRLTGDPRVAALQEIAPGRLRVHLKDGSTFEFWPERGNEASLVNLPKDADARASTLLPETRTFSSPNEERASGAVAIRAIKASEAPVGAGPIRYEIDLTAMDNGAHALLIRGPPLRGPPGGPSGPPPTGPGGFSFGSGDAASPPFRIVAIASEDSKPARRLNLIVSETAQERTQEAFAELAKLDINASLAAGAPKPVAAGASQSREALLALVLRQQEALSALAARGDVRLLQSVAQDARNAGIVALKNGDEIAAQKFFALGGRAPDAQAGTFAYETAEAAALGRQPRPVPLLNETRTDQAGPGVSEIFAKARSGANGQIDRAVFLDLATKAQADKAAWTQLRHALGAAVARSENGRLRTIVQDGLLAVEPTGCRVSAAQPITLDQITELAKSGNVYLEERLLARLNVAQGEGAPRFVQFSFAQSDAEIAARAALLQPDAYIWGRLRLVQVDTEVLAAAKRGELTQYVASPQARAAALAALLDAAISGFTISNPKVALPMFISEVGLLPDGCRGPDLLAPSLVVPAQRNPA